MVILLTNRRCKHEGVKRSFVAMQNPMSSPTHPDTIFKVNLDIFANVKGSKQEIYPVTVVEIMHKQRRYSELKAYFKQKFPRRQKANRNFSAKVIDKV